MKKQNHENKENNSFMYIVKYLVRIIFAIAIIYGAIFAINYFKESNNIIYTEDALIEAPVITLGPINPGVLDSIFVQEGQYIEKNMIVAMVNSNPVISKINGQVLYVQNVPGQVVSSQSGLVEMIDPEELRVVGRIKENKGLVDIKVGQKVKFTVDAYSSEEFEGIVESISPAPRQSALSFSISNSREENEFNVKVKYDLEKYHKFTQGMSAKMWIYKN